MCHIPPHGLIPWEDLPPPTHFVPLEVRIHMDCERSLICLSTLPLHPSASWEADGPEWKPSVSPGFILGLANGRPRRDQRERGEWGWGAYAPSSLSVGSLGLATVLPYSQSYKATLCTQPSLSPRPGLLHCNSRRFWKLHNAQNATLHHVSQ